MADIKERGLYGKYRVERVDGKDIGRCIVLELDDPNAWPALLTWADTVEADGYEALAADVRQWVTESQEAAYRSVVVCPKCRTFFDPEDLDLHVECCGGGA